MKTISSIKAGMLAALLLTACDRSTEPRIGEGGTVRSIAALKALCNGKSFAMRQDLSIRGRVTGNDRFGEFYKTVVIEDASGGITIAADGSGLSACYPFGCELTVRCNGLWLYDYGGKIVLGTEPGEKGVGRIPARDLPLHLSANRNVAEPMRPVRVAIPEIDIRRTDTYVRLDGVRFTDAGEEWCRRDPATGGRMTTEHPIEDEAGNPFVVRVAGTSEYALELVPSGIGSLCGVVDYFNGKFSLRITNYEVDFPISAALPTTCPSGGKYAGPKPRR